MAESFIAGWFGGVCVLAVTHPFDTIKVRIQGASFDNRNLVDLEEKLKARAARIAAAEEKKKAALLNAKRLASAGGWQVAFKDALSTGGSLTGGGFGHCKYRTAMLNKASETIGKMKTSHASASTDGLLAKGAAGVLSSANLPVGGAAASSSSSAAATAMDGVGGARPLNCRAPVKMSSRDTCGVMWDILHGEGIRGFYKGVVAPLSGVGFATAAQFGVYGIVNNYLSTMRYGGDVHNLSDHLQNTNNLDVLDKVVSATCGGVAYAMIIAPFEVVKVRLQTQIYFDHRKYFGALGCARKLYREGGLRKLYLGIDVMLLRDIIGSVVYFGSYGLLRQALPQGDARENIASTLLAGGCAGVTQWAIIFPLDTIKTRQQIAKQGTYIDWVHCGRVLYRKEGAAAFYYGIGPALLRAFVGNAICFGGVEAAMSMMESLEMFQDDHQYQYDA